MDASQRNTSHRLVVLSFFLSSSLSLNASLMVRDRDTTDCNIRKEDTLEAVILRPNFIFVPDFEAFIGLKSTRENWKCQNILSRLATNECLQFSLLGSLTCCCFCQIGDLRPLFSFFYIYIYIYTNLIQGCRAKSQYLNAPLAAVSRKSSETCSNPSGRRYLESNQRI